MERVWSRDQRRSWKFVTLLILVLWLAPMTLHAAPRADEIVYVVQPGDTLRGIAARYETSISAIVRANNLRDADTIFPGQRLVIPAANATAAPTATPVAPGLQPPAPTLTPILTLTPLPRTDAVFHEVQLGDTIAKIAAAYGVRAEAIIQANGISNPDLIWVGQRLVVPGAGAEPPAPTAAPLQIKLPNPIIIGARPTPTPVASVTPTVTPTITPTLTATVTPSPQPTLSGPVVHVVAPGDTLGQIAKRYDVTVAALMELNGLGSADLLRIGTRLAIPPAGGSEAVVSLPKPTSFVVSISQQRCWLYQGETVIAKWVCSTGRSGAGTRPGTYSIQSKIPKAYGSTWDIWMPFWLGIYWAGASENGIHGLPWDAQTGAQVWTGYVGTPITFGCVMLDNVNVKMLYDVAYIGMPVIINP